jgi:hypothetical protein
MDTPWLIRSRIPLSYRLSRLGWRDFWHAVGTVFALHRLGVGWLDSLDLAWWVLWTLPEDYDT